MLKERYQKPLEKELERNGATALQRGNNAEQRAVLFFRQMPGVELAYNFFQGHARVRKLNRHRKQRI